MLDWADRLDEAERKKWYSLCRGMGALGAGLAGFLFEGYAIRHTSTNDNNNPFHHFARMTRAATQSEAMPIRFVCQGEDTTAKLVVRPDGNLAIRFRPSGVPPAVAGGATLDTPWAHRERVRYDKIENIFTTELSYYCPNRRNNPLFDAIFLSVEDGRIVLWILQMTIAREHKCVRSGFDLVRSFRKRVSDVWIQDQVEVKYVLIVPRLNATYDVEWNFTAEFDEHEGEVYVQFLDVSAFQRNKGTIADVIGVHPEEEVMMVETAT